MFEHYSVYLCGKNNKILLTKTIFLVRHGETDYNRRGVVQGSGIDSDLNALGQQQANAFFEAYREQKFDKIYISKLKRTFQSVQKFIESGIPTEKFQGLNEISWGVKEGKIPNTEDDEYFKNLIQNWRAGNTSMPTQEGESPEDVVKRQKEVFDIILSRPEEETILICMHGRVIRILLTQLLGKPLSSMDEFGHSNLCLYKLIYSYATQTFSLEIANDTAHLAGLVTAAE
jgi:broad specificity phosphatase PhoE